MLRKYECTTGSYPAFELFKLYVYFPKFLHHIWYDIFPSGVHYIKLFCMLLLPPLKICAASSPSICRGCEVSLKFLMSGQKI